MKVIGLRVIGSEEWKNEEVYQNFHVEEGYTKSPKSQIIKQSSQ